MNTYKVKKKYRYKSEYKLYNEIKKRYRDVIYQYRVDWLGRQSIDIYIKSKRIGIEYQGLQHFKPIKYFGGKEEYKIQYKNDKKKRDLCKEHGVTLLYFSFDKNAPNKFLGKKVYKDINKLIKRIRYNWIYKIW